MHYTEIKKQRLILRACSRDLSLFTRHYREDMYSAHSIIEWRQKHNCWTHRWQSSGVDVKQSVERSFHFKRCITQAFAYVDLHIAAAVKLLSTIKNCAPENNTIRITDHTVYSPMSSPSRPSVGQLTRVVQLTGLMARAYIFRHFVFLFLIYRDMAIFQHRNICTNPTQLKQMY